MSQYAILILPAAPEEEQQGPKAQDRKKVVDAIQKMTHTVPGILRLGEDSWQLALNSVIQILATVLQTAHSSPYGYQLLFVLGEPQWVKYKPAGGALHFSHEAKPMALGGQN
jgi:hypothetical protein